MPGGRASAPITPGTGRRGYYIYSYGTHVWVPVIDASWVRGMVRDSPRTSIPPGALYDSADYLLNGPGVATKRGGWEYAGAAMTSATYAAGVAYAPFPAGSKLLGIGDNGHLYTIAGSTSDISSMGSAYATKDIPKFRVGANKNLLVITANDGTTVPMTYDGTTVTALTGSPPAGKFAEIYKARYILANIAANPTRIFFSPSPDITATWDTSESWIDANYPVTGMAALTNVLLVFSSGHTERIIGTTPPPGSDMDLATLWSTGCTDARSIVVVDQQVIFANQRGVYLTNGSSIVSLTAQGNIDTYWQSLLEGYDASTWTISAGLMRANYLFVSITDNNGAAVATLMCNVPQRAWWRVTNIQATMFARALGVQDELYFSSRATNRVNALGSIWTPDSSHQSDADGTAVKPYIEFRAIGDGTGIKQYGFGRLSYSMVDGGSTPTMTITNKSGVEADTVWTAAESPLAASAASSRHRWSVCRAAQAITIALQQTAASTSTNIYAMELEERQKPQGFEGIS